jgi:hypothetical protein
MRDWQHIPTANGNADVQMFVGTATAANTAWRTWQKPRGKTMLSIDLVGAGGNGGTGVIAAAGAAGGGAGGQSGASTRVLIPLHMVPDTLFLSLAGTKPTATANFASVVSIAPTNLVGHVLAFANGGLHGGNASGGTGGTVGTAAAIASNSSMSLGWAFLQSALAAQVGTAGGAAVAAANLGLPSTGAYVTGGTGGGGLPAAGVGTNGGNITGGAPLFPVLLGGVGGSALTTPPTPGNAGMRPIARVMYGYGGTGGGSTHAAAGGAGLVQASGGNGAPGCGGGGMGGALTGSTAGVVGIGGPAYAILTCW